MCFSQERVLKLVDLHVWMGYHSGRASFGAIDDCLLSMPFNT